MKLFSGILAVSVVIASTLTVKAQTLSIRAGFTFANLHSESNNPDGGFDMKLKHGYQLGVMTEFLITKQLAIETGVLFSTKGYRIKEDIESGFGPTFEFKERVELIYAEIPVHLTGTFKAGKLNLYGTFGPYLGYGIYGSMKSEVTIFGEIETLSDDIKWGTDKEEDFLKRLDYGLTAGAGIDLKKVRIGVSYSYGLANISSYTDDGGKLHNRVIGLAVSYRFIPSATE